MIKIAQDGKEYKKIEYEVIDKWYCKLCNYEFERNIKLKSIPKCPKCKTCKLVYRGQIAR